MKRFQGVFLVRRCRIGYNGISILTTHPKDESGTELFPNEVIDTRSTQLPAAHPSVSFSFKKISAPLLAF